MQSYMKTGRGHFIVAFTLRGSVRCCAKGRESRDLGMSRRRGLLGLAAWPTIAAAPASCREAQYDRLAGDYDILDGGKIPDILGLTSLRQKLLAKASGDVLEVGIGTGLNLQWYIPSNVNSLTGLDVSSGMLNVAAHRASSLDWSEKVTLMQGDVSNLPFEDNSFDMVVDTYSLCVFPNPLSALSEMSRVIRPSGKILLLEHSRSTNPALGLYQDVVAEPVSVMSKGCVWNQDVLNLLDHSQLVPVEVASELGGFIVLAVSIPK